LVQGIRVPPPTIDAWTQAVAGDPDVFALFYRYYVDRVFSHCYNRLGERSDAEDLTAEVFAICWRSRQKVFFHDEAGILPWLLKTANNLLHDHHRWRTRAVRVLQRLSLQDEPDVAAVYAEEAELAQETAEALAVLRALKPRDREIIELAVIQDLSSSAIAVVLGIPASTARNRLARALRHARDMHAQLHLSDEPAGEVPR
jgi:RNA polymerase sigma-70 factor (ECF subfamily)